MKQHSNLTVLDDDVDGLVVLTVYARAHPAVCSRMMQLLAVHRIGIERFVADFGPAALRGLDPSGDPVMRVELAVCATTENRLRRLVAVITRMVDVYEVEQS